MSIGVETLIRIQYYIEVEGNTPTQEQPFTVVVRKGHTGVEAEVLAYDRLGVALRGLAVWGNNGVAPLEELAQAISQRVTYLWERLVLVEWDLEREAVQMRSAPPLIEDKAVEFYEGWLTRQGGSPRLHLVRYRRENGQSRRREVPITLTHQVFRRLIDDLSSILQAPEVE